MQVRQITPSIGAELSGVDLGQASRDEGLYKEIRTQLLKHKVLFLRNQDITRAEHVAFARRFGDLEDHPVAGSDPDHPGLVLIHRSDTKESYENSFHSDGMWRPNPAMGAVLRCIECPPLGGDTLWVNMVQAYENLPEDIKQLILPLRASNSIEHSFGAVMAPEARRKLGRDHPPVEHPVVRTHPETGEKSLFVSGFTTHFLNFHNPKNVRFGLDKAPGAALLLNYLISQATVPEYHVRWSWRPNDVAIWDNRCTSHYAVHDYWPAPRKMERAGIVGDIPFSLQPPLLPGHLRLAATPTWKTSMNFLDGHLFPENQQPLIITAAPYAPGWIPSDFPEDIPVTMGEQIDKAVDCYNAGATVLHLHVRELDGKGSKRLSMFNELIAGVRKAVPEMIIQVGGSISFAPESEGSAAKWLSDDTRHMLADLEPTPDQVTVTVNTSQMNVTDHAEDADFRGTSRDNPALFNTFKDMIVPAAPLWVEEHVRRLSAKGIQSTFQCYNTNSFESVERLIRRGFYKGPLVMNWVAIGGGMDTPNVYSLGNFIRGVPDGAVVTVESNVRNVLPVNMMGIAMGLHVRCGTEDGIWNQRRTAKQSSVRQIEQLVRISREFGREIATASQAREICKIGVFYDTADQALAANGFAPNRNGGNQGFLRKSA